MVGWVSGRVGGWFCKEIYPLRGPTCNRLARLKQSWVPSWARVWQYFGTLPLSSPKIPLIGSNPPITPYGSGPTCKNVFSTFHSPSWKYSQLKMAKIVKLSVQSHLYLQFPVSSLLNCLIKIPHILIGL